MSLNAMFVIVGITLGPAFGQNSPDQPRALGDDAARLVRGLGHGRARWKLR
jgi:hypothetical protein